MICGHFCTILTTCTPTSLIHSSSRRSLTSDLRCTALALTAPPPLPPSETSQASFPLPPPLLPPPQSHDFRRAQDVPDGSDGFLLHYKSTRGSLLAPFVKVCPQPCHIRSGGPFQPRPWEQRPGPLSQTQRPRPYKSCLVTVRQKDS